MNEQINDLTIEDNPWERGFYMLLFVFIYSAAEVVMGALVLIHFILVLIHKKQDMRLKDFGKDLSQYIYHIFLFLTYNSDDKPFPFKSWSSEVQPKIHS